MQSEALEHKEEAEALGKVLKLIYTLQFLVNIGYFDGVTLPVPDGVSEEILPDNSKQYTFSTSVFLPTKNAELPDIALKRIYLLITMNNNENIVKAGILAVISRKTRTYIISIPEQYTLVIPLYRSKLGGDREIIKYAFENPDILKELLDLVKNRLKKITDEWIKTFTDLKSAVGEVELQKAFSSIRDLIIEHKISEIVDLL